MERVEKKNGEQKGWRKNKNRLEREEGKMDRIRVGWREIKRRMKR